MKYQPLYIAKSQHYSSDLVECVGILLYLVVNGGDDGGDDDRVRDVPLSGHTG